MRVEQIFEINIYKILISYSTRNPETTILYEIC